MLRRFGSFLLAAIIVLLAAEAHARPFRVQQIPNGAVNGCLTCHIVAGGPRNPFGVAIEFGFLDGFGNVLWGPALAALDSDGDGRSNGHELLDPAGTWVTGQPNPGQPSMVRAPGVVDAPPAVPAMSFAGFAMLAGALWLAGASALRRRRFSSGASLLLVISSTFGTTGCSNGDRSASDANVAQPGSRSVAQAIAVDPPIVIRQVYGGGGNSGATYTHDFIELFNRSSAPASLAGHSLQYTSAMGGGNFGANVTTLPAVTLQPGQSFLVQEAQGTGGTTPLPTPDVVASPAIAMAAGAGKVAFVDTTAPLACNTAANCSATDLGHIIDLVGYGNANFFEGSAAVATLSNTTAANRAAGGCADTNQNSADFGATAPAPRSTASPLAPCTPSDAGSDSGSGGAGGAGGAGGNGGSMGGAAGSGGSAGTGGSGGSGGDVGPCGSPATPIGAIQGFGASSPMVGATVVIEGVVVGDFQINDLNGFFLQEEDGGQDGDPTTSDGIFVFEGASTTPVSVGDVIRVRGTIAELSSLTELTNVTGIVPCGAGAASATPLTFPVPAVADLERYEGMLVHIAQPLTVTGNFELGRFGSLDLSVGGRLYQPTNIVSPGAAAILQQNTNERSRIILDDLATAQNPTPIPYKDANNTRRVGDQVPTLTGVLDGRFGAYRVMPTAPVLFANGNPRPAAPSAIGGRLRVASFNVLNFFTTLDTGSPVCGPSGGLDCRGADNASEFTRQREKLLNAMVTLDADVVGLTEIENNASAATQSLVDGLNGRVGAGTYAFVDTGTIGTDAIKLALVYKTAKVSTAGAFAVLTTAVDSRFIDTKNRPALAQTFQEIATGARFTIVVNHLKSKGSACDDVGDPDLDDGQGNCNQTRNKAAQALRDWMATDPTHAGDPDFLVMGDLNAYAKEDPITTLRAAGFDDVVARFVGASAYSYQFQGQSGYLDHALASPALAAQITGATEWHGNADEPVVLDYNTEFKTDDPFTLADPFRASDHDAVIVGLNLTTAAPVPAMGAGFGAGLAALLALLGRARISRRHPARGARSRDGSSRERRSHLG